MSLAPFILLGALAILDVLTTTRALRVPSNREANPVVAWAMKHLGRGWIIVKLILTIVCGVLLWPWPLVVWGIDVLMLWVVWRNWRLVA